jgi:uncharacterized protein
MRLTGAYRVPAPRERVFATLTDPAALQRLIPGCESLVKRDDSVYVARLKAGLGSIKGTYTGEVRMTNVNQPESYTLIVDGRGSGGFAKGTANIRLTAVEAETEVDCSADVTVGGAIAAVGSRLVEVAARRMMDWFFAALLVEVSQQEGQKISKE